jgi:hypothetical protein
VGRLATLCVTGRGVWCAPVCEMYLSSNWPNSAEHMGLPADEGYFSACARCCKTQHLSGLCLCRKGESKIRAGRSGPAQPVLELSQVLQLPYSNSSWRLLKSRDHSALRFYSAHSVRCARHRHAILHCLLLAALPARLGTRASAPLLLVLLGLPPQRVQVSELPGTYRAAI